MPLSPPQLGFVLVCAAGSATGIGAAVVFSETLVQMASKKFLAGSLGVAAGVMLYVSFVEIFVKSQMAFEASSSFGPGDAYFAATASVFAGMVFMSLLDTLVHALEPHAAASQSSDPGRCLAAEAEVEVLPERKPCCVTMNEATWDQIASGRRPTRAAAGAPAQPDLEGDRASDEAGASDVEMSETGSTPHAHAHKPESAGDAKLRSMGVMTAVAIGLHNFPEGLATFVATLDDPAVGGALAIAIAIHNIPEGLCVSIPIYFATGDRWKAFRWALLSGASEPVGAALGWVLLKNHFNETVYGVIFGMVAGMMIMICMHELIPTAHRYDPMDQYVTKAIVGGMLIMAASLCLFVYG